MTKSAPIPPGTHSGPFGIGAGRIRGSLAPTVTGSGPGRTLSATAGQRAPPRL